MCVVARAGLGDCGGWSRAGRLGKQHNSGAFPPEPAAACMHACMYVSPPQTATRRPLANALLTTLFATIVFLIVGWGVTVLNLGLPASLAMSITTIVVVTLLMSPMDGRVKVEPTLLSAPSSPGPPRIFCW